MSAAEDVLAGTARWALMQGHVLDRLRELPDECVHTVVTSPPYFGLRDYGTATWEGGDADCTHKVRPAGSGIATVGLDGGRATQGHQQEGYRRECGRCGALRVDHQIGLEASPAAWVATMVAVFAEVRRVLRKDGTCWINVGDSYAAAGGHAGQGSTSQRKGRANVAAQNHAPTRVAAGFKAKDLYGLPWRAAFALQEAGWYLRCDIVWHKPNPMPESTTDRPTKAHEYLFLLSRSPRYYYDADAIKEPVTGGTPGREGTVPFTARGVRKVSGQTSKALSRPCPRPRHRGGLSGSTSGGRIANLVSRRRAPHQAPASRRTNRSTPRRSTW